MTSDNIAALQEIERNGRAFLNTIDSLCLSKEVDVELLNIAYVQVLNSIAIANKAIKDE